MMKKQKKKEHYAVFKRWSRTPYAVFNSLHKVVKIGTLLASCSLVLLKGQSTQAQNAGSDTVSGREVTLDGLVITAEKPVLQQPVIEVVAVINRNDIEQAAVQNLQDLLRYVQGIDLRSRGSEGVQADISLRGGTFDQTLVLLNGINFSDPQTGHYSLNIPIDLNSIERIEVVQGPGLWASGGFAFCGAINIVTRKSDTNTADINLSGGQYGYYQVGGGGALANTKRYLSINANKSASKGFAYNTDFNIGNVFLSAGFSGEKSGSLDFQAGFQQKDYGANSFYSMIYKEQYENIGVFLTSLKYKKQWTNWQNLSSVFYRRLHDKFELFRYDSPDWYKGHNYHVTDVFGANTQMGYTWAAGLTSIGVNYRGEHIYSSNMGEPLSTPKEDPYSNDGIFYYAKLRQYAGVYLQHLIEYKKWQTNVGIMSSGNSDFGFKWYGSGSALYAIKRNLQISCYLQNVYRMPTFTDLYYKSPAQIGNPNLNPEKSVNTELVLAWQPKQWSFRLSGFYRYGFQIIDWVRKPLEVVWQSKNIADIQSGGMDIAATYWWFGNRFLKKAQINYTFMALSKKDNGYLSLYATDYLRNQVKLSVEHKIWKALSMSYLISFQDRAGTYLDVEKEKEVSYKPYVLCDLRLSWDKEHYSIFAEGSNIFNTKYSDIGNLAQPGIWVKAGLSVKI